MMDSPQYTIFFDLVKPPLPTAGWRMHVPARHMTCTDGEVPLDEKEQ